MSEARLNQPLISVIILNYNNGEFLEQCIHSVLGQTYKNVQILFVDNGSTDNSLDIAQKYSRNLEIVKIESNLRQASGRNVGLAQVKGDLICLLDSDDWWHCEKLELQSKLIRKGVELVYTSALTQLGSKNLAYRAKYRGDCSEFFYDARMPAVVLCGESSVMFTRELLSDVGWFDETLDSSSGWDFFRRCTNFTHFDFLDAPLVYYRQHSNNLSRNYLAVSIDCQRAFSKGLYTLSVSSFNKRLIMLKAQSFLYRGVLAKPSRLKHNSRQFCKLIRESVIILWKL